MSIEAIQHIEQCSDDNCAECEGYLELYMACDYCGSVGMKDAGGWGEPTPEGIPCCHCEIKAQQGKA